MRSVSSRPLLPAAILLCSSVAVASTNKPAYDPARAKQATVVLRVELVQAAEGVDKYGFDLVRPLRVFKNASKEQFRAPFRVAFRSDQTGVPAGVSTIYLEPYGGRGGWKLLGGGATKGVSHHGAPATRRKARFDPAGDTIQGACRARFGCMPAAFTRSFSGYSRSTSQLPPAKRGVSFFDGNKTTPATNAEKARLAKRLHKHERTRFVAGKLGFTLDTLTFSTAAAAKRAVAHFLATATTNTGHTYGWDYAVHVGSRVHVLTAGCVYSRANWTRMASKLRQSVAPTKNSLEVSCTCGNGCAPGAPR